MPRPYNLPSLRALSSFEAAARHLSFKTAARELNVTPTAISHQVRALEDDLGQPLFRRQHRGVELTAAGAYLFTTLQRSFEAISDTVDGLRGTGRDGVTVLVSTAMSALWLTPKLTDYWRLHPDSEVSQIVSDADIPDAAADLSLCYGDIDADTGDCALLFRDRICAVGAPGFARRHVITQARDLQRAPLIHMTDTRHQWTDWTGWLGALGCPAPRGHRIAVNNYMIALQMAKDGLGAVLGWDGLVGPLIEAGELDQLVDDRIVSPNCFYIKTHRRASDPARRFRDWLVSTHAGAVPVARVAE
ncbi:LysR family transcriptional regulator [Maribius pontilimi]|uniref:LysR family transcriptional regulator n=1 Tax=Palleronia pontilimi TaxID=1964209 RepID=A0A934IHU8_9RHOB|nr:LysR family transcriptional regulator [Palleronia pontilimi]MBJ3763645.1 LysR family transcriptional regulator [Palleronia pontilimi]